MTRIYHEVLLKQKVVKEQTCNWCGEICHSSGNINFGYGAKHDGDSASFDICDNCYDKFLKDKCMEESTDSDDTVEV